jgi:hypothetical protein
MCQCQNNNTNLTFGQQVMMRVISGVIVTVVGGIILAILF